MVVLHCTRKLLARLNSAGSLGADPARDASGPKLGDWYATMFVVARRRLVLAAAEHSLCPVVLPLAPARTLVPRWREAVARKLAALGIPGPAADAEGAAITEVAVAPISYRTLVGRCMVGVLTDMVYACRYGLRLRSPIVDVRTGLNLRLSGGTVASVVPDLTGMEAALDGMPCAPLRYASPADATRALFGLGPARGAPMRDGR